MNVVVLGAQGAGKGIISTFLKEKYGFCHISTGQLFRDEISKKTKLGDLLAFYMNKGELVPDDVVFKILEKVLNNSDSFILDGFPRNIQQAKRLDELTKIDLVVNIKVPNEILIQRLAARRNCPNCKETFSMLTYNSNFCNKCNELLVQRDDDVPEAISKRLEIFYKNIEPIINFYKQKNILASIDNTGNVEQTYKLIEKIIKNLKN